MPSKKKNKFRLSQIQHRTQKKDLLHDVIIDGKIEQDYPVGWVRIMGTDNPTYLQKCKEHIIDYQAAMDDMDEADKTEDKTAKTKALTELVRRFEIQSVSNSIVDWDIGFFEESFSPEAAVTFFENTDNNIFFNQVSRYMQERSDFLPIASM